MKAKYKEYDMVRIMVGSYKNSIGAIKAIIPMTHPYSDNQYKYYLTVWVKEKGRKCAVHLIIEELNLELLRIA